MKTSYKSFSPDFASNLPAFPWPQRYTPRWRPRVAINSHPKKALASEEGEDGDNTTDIGAHTADEDRDDEEDEEDEPVAGEHSENRDGSTPSAGETIPATPDSAQEELDAKNAEEPDIDVHMLVSSRHLMLASPVFKAMLRHGNFKEGRELGSTGRLDIPLPDDDPEAFIVLLDIIHGRNRRVPRQIGLDLMANIAILVDKYQMVEVAEVFSEAWIEDLKLDIPSDYENSKLRPRVHKWTCIAWVFGKRKEFKDMTKLMEQHCGADLGEQIEKCFPIPNIIIDAIKQKREAALFELYALVEQIIRRYRRKDIFCPRTDDKNLRPACDAMLLGSLLKNAIAAGLYPPPTSPYGEETYAYVADNLDRLEAEALCGKIRPFTKEKPHKNSHGFHLLAVAKIQELDERLSGLDINDFKKAIRTS